MISLRGVHIDYPVHNRFLASEVKTILRNSQRVILRDSTMSATTLVAGLDNVTLTVLPGEAVGLIGINGSGKTTLLKTMAGIYKPTKGDITIHGRVRGFFNLSAGLDNSLTGTENIRNLAYFYTKDPCEIDVRMGDIIDFAGLGEFIHMPVSTYSSGMLARLLVSVAIHFDAEHLLFDEGLGAGDSPFIAKLSKRISEMVSNAKTLVLASHSFPMLKEYCQRGILLRNGRVVFDGSLHEAFGEYNRLYSV